MKTNNLTRCALLTAMALIIHVLEAQLPPLAPIPSVKIGLANIITLAAMYIVGKRQAFLILVVRIILGNFFSGQMMSLIYSLCGGALCYLVTVCLKPIFKSNTMWFLGVAGAIAHSIGQLACACVLFRSLSFIYYAPVMCIFSCISGTFTGLCAQFMVKHFDGLSKKK